MVVAETAVRMKVLDAFVECVVELGIEKATYRAVAKRAQVGLGTVQHYFPDKTSLINEALLVEHRKARERHAAPIDGDEPSDLARAIEGRLSGWLHLTPEERRIFPFYLEYWAHASREPELRDFHAHRWEQISSEILDMISRDREGENLPGLLDPADTTAALIALVYGLNATLTLHPSEYPSDRVSRIMHAVTETLLNCSDRADESTTDTADPSAV